MKNIWFFRANKSFNQGQKDYLEGIKWARFEQDPDYKRGVLLQHGHIRHEQAGYRH